MIITKSKDKKKQQEVALSKENPVLSEEEEMLSEKEKMLFEEEKILSEEEMKACKNRLLEREKKTNKEVIDFLKQYINNGNNGIIPQNFKKKCTPGREYFQKGIQPKEKPEQKIQATYLSGNRHYVERHRAKSYRQILSQVRSRRATEESTETSERIHLASRYTHERNIRNDAGGRKS